METKAYIVTFERTDPFYVFNLTDPSNPQKIGELEIPGFSSYLHPIEIDGVPLMLGIGSHVNETTGWETGLKISLFNVSDPMNLKEIAVLVDEGAYSSGRCVHELDDQRCILCYR
jgi:DNA excision repair protein ERCC-4